MGNIKGEFPFTMNNAQDIRFCNKSWFKVEQSGNLLNLSRIIPLVLGKGRSGKNQEENA